MLTGTLTSHQRLRDSALRTLSLFSAGLSVSAGGCAQGNDRSSISVVMLAGAFEQFLAAFGQMQNA
jgi:hypothetical protein